MRHNVECAFSGLEAAIVLIAFIVVATIFSYSVLGSGMFASETASGSTHGAVKQSMSNLVMEGYIYGTYTNGIDTIGMTLAVPEGGNPQDLSKIKLVWNIKGQSPVELQHGLTGILTDKQKRFVSGIPIPTGNRPIGGETFTLQIMPENGAPCLLTRDVPAGYTGGILH